MGYWKGSRSSGGISSSEFNQKTQFALKTILTLLVLLIAVTLYYFLRELGYQYTAAMFAGIPAVIAYFIVLTRQFERQFLTVFLAITLFLLITWLFMREGIVCLLFAIPVLYTVGFGAVWGARWGFKKSSGYAGKILMALTLAVISLEGVVPGYEFNRIYTVTQTETIALPAAQVRSNLAHNPDFSNLPTEWLKWVRLPVPVAAHGDGLQAGDVREFVFQRADGVQELVVFRIDYADEQRAVLVPVRDETLINQWLGWQKTELTWTPADADNTVMSASMTFERKLDPAWYFGPVQKLVVRQATRVLIEHGRQTPSDKLDVNFANN